MKRGQKRPIEVLIFRDLLTHDVMTAKELAYRYEVSTRTIFRAVDTLTINCIPIKTLRGKYGGLYLDKDYINDFVGGGIKCKKKN